MRMRAHYKRHSQGGQPLNKRDVWLAKANIEVDNLEVLSEFLPTRISQYLKASADFPKLIEIVMDCKKLIRLLLMPYLKY